jgi:hypothetical protein
MALQPSFHHAQSVQVPQCCCQEIKFFRFLDLYMLVGRDTYWMASEE